MNKELMKLFSKESFIGFNKNGLYLMLYIIVIGIFFDQNNYVGYVLQWLFFYESILKNRKINSLDIFIRVGGTRREYYFNRIIYNIIMVIIFTIISIISDTTVMNKVSIDTVIGYFLYYMTCASLNIFIRILSKSSYGAVEYGMLFFYFITFIGVSSCKNQLRMFYMVSIVLNFFISSFAYRTIEID